MTRKEIIDGLEIYTVGRLNKARVHITVEELQKFINAIKALEQEPTNDLGVNWDELKRKIFMEVDGGTDDKWLRYADVCDNISNSIDDFKSDLPSVTPIRPKGHWIPRNSFLLQYKCSECNYESERYNFCPNCGSDNREVEE